MKPIPAIHLKMLITSTNLEPIFGYPVFLCAWEIALRNGL